MDEKKEPAEVAEIQDLDIEPLSDQDLDSVAGGDSCSCCETESYCTGGTTELA